MAGIFATAGARLYIGGSLAAQTTDFVLGDFSGQSWVAVNWMENIGSFRTLFYRSGDDRT